MNYSFNADSEFHGISGGHLPPALIETTALVHEWLTDWGGSERVSAEITGCLGSPDIYALIEFLTPTQRALLGGRSITSSFIQSLPLARTRFWYYLPLMPLAVETFDLRKYELIVSSSHAFAKGALTSSDQLHISYIHSPMRYAWDLYHEYLSDYGLTRGLKAHLAKFLFHRLRNWDRQTANNVDLFLANSQHVANRIWRTYRRRSLVLYPPVETERFQTAAQKEDYFVSVSRLVSYKRVDLAVEAFNRMPDKRLLVIGDGPEIQALKQKAQRNVEFLGYQPDTIVADYLARARALIFPANEDFGITPVEAQAAGTPVLAFGKGGALETIKDAATSENGTGLFFPTQSADAIVEVLRNNEARLAGISTQDCQLNAQRFSAATFRTRFADLLQLATASWKQTRNNPDTFESLVLKNA